MKKMIRTLLLAALLGSALTVSALAAGGENGYDLEFYRDGGNYLAADLGVPGESAPEGYCVALYCSDDPDTYQELLYDAYEEEYDIEFIATQKGTYDMAQVLLGVDSWYGDPDAVILDQWELDKPIVVEEKAFTLPASASLEHMRELDAEEGYACYELDGVEPQYSYIADDDDLWCIHLLGRGDCSLYFCGLEDGSPVDIYGLEVTDEGDYYLQRVSRPKTLDLPPLSREDTYSVRMIADPTMLYAAFAVHSSMDTDGLYTLCLYNSNYGMDGGYVALEGYMPGEWIPVTNVNGYADRVAIFPYGAYEGVDYADQPYFANLDLEKAVGGFPDIMDFPGQVEAMAFELGEGECAYAFNGLYFDYYSYILSNPSTGALMVIVEPDDELYGFPLVYHTSDWVGEGMELRAVLVQEQEEGYAVIYSAPITVDIPLEEGEEKSVLSMTVSGGGTVTLGNHRVEINGIEVGTGAEDISFTTEGELVLNCTEEVWGYYDVVITRPGCLTYTIKKVEVSGEDIDLGTIELIAGDVNEDDKINIQDMGVFRQEFGKTGENIGNSYTDVNHDGKVNIQDMGIFRQNFGKTAEKDCTVEY